MSDDLPRLEKWTPVPHDGGPFFLVGAAYGRAGKPDGHVVRTSVVTSAGGGLATTLSGTVYRLGEPSAEYLEVRRRRGDWDPADPLRHGVP